MAAQLLTLDQLADYLQVPARTVYAWNTKGVGPKRIRVGREVRYRASDVEAWLKQQEVDELTFT